MTLEGTSEREWDSMTEDGHLASTHRWHRAHESSARRYLLVRKQRELVGAATVALAPLDLSPLMNAGSAGEALVKRFRPQAFYVMPFASTHRAGLYLREGADPEEVGDALAATLRAHAVQALVAPFLPRHESGPLRRLAQTAIGGRLWPWLSRVRRTPVAARVDPNVIVANDAADHADALAGLAAVARRSSRLGTTWPNVGDLSEPRFYRHAAQLGADVACARLRDPDGGLKAAALGLVGKKTLAVIMAGAVDDVEVTSVLSALERVAHDKKLAFELGPLLAPRGGQPLAARIWVRGAAASATLRCLEALGAPTLDASEDA